MKINVTTTIEIDKEEGEQLTQDDVEKAYDDFKGIIEDAHFSGDLELFSFINPDTGFEIEDEVV